MRKAFIEKSFSAVAESIIRTAGRIIADYQSQGFDMTLRQLYYQFIAGDLFPDGWEVVLPGGQRTKNHERNYKKLGTILADARMAGRIDWSAITDRTRELVEWRHETSVADAIRRIRRSYSLDMWTDQDIVVEVWVEKEALAGVFHQVCAKWDVPYFACRGYTSVSAAYEAYRRISGRVDQGRRTLVLHFGDHDPSGIDMTRDIRDRLSLMLGSDRLGSDFDNCFEVRRMALNMDQVRAFDPPPSPAKITDSRAADYIAAFGDDSWELDALDPRKLTELADTAIQSVIDWGRWDATLERAKQHRRCLDKIISELKV